MPAIGAVVSPCIIASMIIMHMPVIRKATPMIVITHLIRLPALGTVAVNWSYGCGI
jgi:hypothetical protein